MHRHLLSRHYYFSCLSNSQQLVSQLSTLNASFQDKKLFQSCVWIGKAGRAKIKAHPLHGTFYTNCYVIQIQPVRAGEDALFFFGAQRGKK
jgi:hypothetical protein